MGNYHVNTIIVASIDADFTKHVYNQVYASADAVVTINGVVVTLKAGLTLDIIINDIIPAVGVFLLGKPINIYTHSPNLGSING